MSEDDLEKMRKMIADWIGTSIQRAKEGSDAAHREIVRLYREALEDGIFPDGRITAFILETLLDPRVMRALYPPETQGRPADPRIAERDLNIAREVVRRQREAEAKGTKLNETDAIADTAEARNLSEPLVKKAYETRREAAQKIETPAQFLPKK